MDRTGARIDEGRRQRWLTRTARLVFEDGDMPGRSPSKCGDGKIDLAIAIEIARFHVGDAGQAVGPEAAELSAAERTHPDHRAIGVIAREKLTEVRDEQILESVAIDVGEGDVIGMRNIGDHLQRALRFEMSPEDGSLIHLRADHVDLAVAVEVSDLDVR